MKKQGGQLAVGFDAHCCHLNIAEATELMTRLVKREVGGSADEPQMAVCSGAYRIAAGSCRNIRSAMM